MKTTLDLPDELIREVKLRAVVQRRTVKDLVAEFLRQGLGMAPATSRQPPPAGSMVEIGPEGLPVIKCQPNAPATRMSAKKLLQLEQAAQTGEDLKHAGFPV
jgi:plasmid stability protein